ncbi:MAG: sugar ABC transporter ATP-binding protein [Thermoactinomyces sp.]
MNTGGKELHWSGPAEARKNGISVIHQELCLCPNITVAENIFLGKRYPTKAGLVNWKKLFYQAQEIIDHMGIDLKPDEDVSNLSVAQQQMVEIARALSLNSKVLIMDEPTASLTNKEIDKLFEIINELKQKKVAIIYISHRMEEIFAISDRCTVMRDGEWVNTVKTSEVNPNQLIKMMVGRELNSFYSYEVEHDVQRKQPILEVKHLSDQGGSIKDISFKIYPGEVVGVSGLVGAGRTEVARAIFGANRLTHGEIFINGEKITIHSPLDAIQHGIAYVPENRKEEGLFPDLSVKENMMRAILKNYRKWGFLSWRKITAKNDELIKKLAIKTATPEQKIIHLSGGNQQKALIARWLSVEPKVLLLDEPTRGIDIGAKQEIYDMIHELADQGLGVLMISSELPEVLGVSDRVLVIHEGRIVADLSKDEADQEKVMFYATGGLK